jgi:hypothetical protein
VLPMRSHGVRCGEILCASSTLVCIGVLSHQPISLHAGDGIGLMGVERTVDRVPSVWKSAKPSERRETFAFHRRRIHFIAASAVTVRTAGVHVA